MQGKFLMPGMIDAHAHPIYGGMSLILANYRDTSDSVPALVQFVSDEMKKEHEPRRRCTHDHRHRYRLLVARCRDRRHAEQWRVCTAIDLPRGFDGHTAWANRLVRTRAGITAGISPEPAA